jgi:hypothetical protein
MRILEFTPNAVTGCQHLFRLNGKKRDKFTTNNKIISHFVSVLVITVFVPKVTENGF